MASFAELETRLAARFKDVPGVDTADLTAWLTEAVYMYGYAPSTVGQIPDAETPLVVLLAQIQGARAIASRTAHYFKYTDAEETVDKTAVSKQWRDLANDLTAQYETDSRLINRRDESAFVRAKRVDRP